jgi:hypothetical protein
MNLIKLQTVIRKDRYEWRKHILIRLSERKIIQADVLKVVLNGEIIEDYPEDKPFPSCLILGWIRKKPFHVVISLDEVSNKAYFITVYEPNLTEFNQDFKTRRKPKNG